MENNFCDTTNPAVTFDDKATVLERILFEVVRAFEAFAEIFADDDRMFLCFEATPWKDVLNATNS